jgi:7-carboxy-7-deazaguanine synthase
MIRVCEIFESIQGEGLTLGAPSVFIRTGKCSVGCRFCDTKYSWDSGRDYTLKEISKIVQESRIPEVVITGGEPLEEEDLPELLKELSSFPQIRRITLETCGHMFRELPKEKLYLVVSPKPPTMGVKFPLSELQRFLKFYTDLELKFTLFSEEDFSVIKEFLNKSKKVPEPIVLQPLNVPTENYSETCRRVISLIFSDRDFINRYRIRIIPQVHKFIGVK